MRLTPAPLDAISVQIPSPLPAQESLGALDAVLRVRCYIPTRRSGAGYTALQGTVWGAEVFVTVWFTLVKGAAARQRSLNFAGVVKASPTGSVVVGGLTAQASSIIRFLPTAMLIVGAALAFAVSPAAIIFLLASPLFYRVAMSQRVVRTWEVEQFAEAIARIFNEQASGLRELPPDPKRSRYQMRQDARDD